MNIRITFRQLDASDAIKDYARSKLAKLQKFLRKPMTAKVTLTLDKVRHIAEAQIRSGGERHEAKEVSEDLYASIDKVADKLERQIRGTKGAARSKKRRAPKVPKKTTKRRARKKVGSSSRASSE